MGNITSFDQCVRIACLHGRANRAGIKSGCQFYTDPTDGHDGVVFTSLPADPLHCGHVRLLLESAELAKSEYRKFIVLVNDDEFLLKKKGYVFMPLAERMEVIAAIAGVDYVVPWSSPTQFVDDAIRALRPRYFTKGGDRSTPEQIASCELAACAEVGCEIKYGVGGSVKVQSSSALVEKYNNAGQKERRFFGPP